MLMNKDTTRIMCFKHQSTRRKHWTSFLFFFIVSGFLILLLPPFRFTPLTLQATSKQHILWVCFAKFLFGLSLDLFEPNDWSILTRRKYWIRIPRSNHDDSWWAYFCHHCTSSLFHSHSFLVLALFSSIHCILDIEERSDSDLQQTLPCYASQSHRRRNNQATSRLYWFSRTIGSMSLIGDLWGPLFICLGLAMYLYALSSHDRTRVLSLQANSNQVSTMFTFVFVLITLGSVVVTINGQLLGAKMYDSFNFSTFSHNS